MKSYPFLITALLSGCATSTFPPQLPTLNPPLSVEEKKIITTCENEVANIMTGQLAKNPFYSAYERTSVMDKCLESQGISDERIGDIFSVLEGNSVSQ